MYLLFCANSSYEVFRSASALIRNKICFRAQIMQSSLFISYLLKGVFWKEWDVVELFGLLDIHSFLSNPILIFVYPCLKLTPSCYWDLMMWLWLRKNEKKEQQKKIKTPLDLTEWTNKPQIDISQPPMTKGGCEVGHQNFWSIVLDDHWSKKICRPNMIVRSAGAIIQHSSSDDFVLITITKI